MAPDKFTARPAAQVPLTVRPDLVMTGTLRGKPMSRMVRLPARSRQPHAVPRLVPGSIEVLGVSVRGVKPTPDTAKALEAEAREAILRNADEAIFARRNFAVEQERAIRQSELDTEIAVEQKKRSIRETQMDAEASVDAIAVS